MSKNKNKDKGGRSFTLHYDELREMIKGELACIVNSLNAQLTAIRHHLKKSPSTWELTNKSTTKKETITADEIIRSDGLTRFVVNYVAGPTIDFNESGTYEKQAINRVAVYELPTSDVGSIKLISDKVKDD